MESVSGGNSELQYGLSFRDMSIEDLCLDFTLPGFPDIVLASGTDHTMVWHCLTFFCNSILTFILSMEEYKFIFFCR